MLTGRNGLDKMGRSTETGKMDLQSESDSLVVTNCFQGRECIWCWLQCCQVRQIFGMKKEGYRRTSVKSYLGWDRKKEEV